MHRLQKVAIQGDRASFHEIAAHQYYQSQVELIYCQSFEQVFTTLFNGLADEAFVAVSNSNHGEISEVISLIARGPVRVKGEYLLPIDQHLIGLPGSDLRGITRIISHPVALSQCDRYLSRSHPEAGLQEYHDTSAAVGLVGQIADPTVVAIGSEAAAELHGLKILRRCIQNDSENATLFRAFSVASARVGARE